MIGTLSPLAADIIGIIGSILFISAFAYANVAKQLNKLWFNIANLGGAILLLISLSVHFNLAAFILEVAWAVIAFVGIVNAIRTKNEPAT
jgi:predicted membrane protein